MRGDCCEQLLGAIQRTAKQRMIDDHALLGLSDGVVDVSNQRVQQRLVLLGDEIVKCFEGRCVWVTCCPSEFPMSVSSLMARGLDYNTLRIQ